MMLQVPRDRAVYYIFPYLAIIDYFFTFMFSKRNPNVPAFVIKAVCNQTKVS